MKYSTNQQDEQMIAKAIEAQRITRQTIAEMIESDEQTALKYEKLTWMLLDMEIREGIDPFFLCQLTALCYYMTPEKFIYSVVLGMINTKQDWENIRHMHEMTMLTYTKHLN